MKIGTMIKQSVRSLAGNPVRSILMVLGVVIGIAAVMAVVVLGSEAATALFASGSAISQTIYIADTP